MTRHSAFRHAAVCILLIFAHGLCSRAQAQSPPFDIWTADVLQRIRDQSTLSTQITANVGYADVFFNSEAGTAKWADSAAPYALHTGDTIRIHGYLVSPLVGGPYPAIVIGHGHGGHGSVELAAAVAALGYVALSIDGPMAGQSTGGPQDTEQAWISVEPSADYSYLYHYAYAGMRALTLFESLSALPGNPFRIDRNNLGVVGASMGGQFTYYVNGIDSRVKGAVAIAVAGDWQRILFYPGAWLYHGLFYYTRDGLVSGTDAPNAVSNVCTDQTMYTFLNHFDPINYAPTQHGPLLTIIGTHDQYFTAPAANTTYDRIQSAGTSPRFTKRTVLAPNGKHGVLDQSDLIQSIQPLLQTINNWLHYAFADGPVPPPVPSVSRSVSGTQMTFTANVAVGSSRIQDVRLYFATQVNTLPAQPNDFGSISLTGAGNNTYTGSINVGDMPPNGPAVTADNILYFVQVNDSAGYTITSKLYYKGEEMGFCSGFVPVIEHYPRDTFPVQPPPSPNCSCTPTINTGGIVNNASFALSPAPLAAGSITAIFGTNLNNGLTVSSSRFGADGKLITSLAGASVTVNNIAAPIFYSTPTQIGIQIPTELSGVTSATVQVALGAQNSSAQTITLDGAAPGMFTLSQDGKGAAAALHQDNVTPVTAANPAKPNEVVVLFATGLGELTPSLGTGIPASANRTVATPVVMVDSIAAEVQFSGGAPGFVGLNQINVKIPANVRSGTDIPVVLSLAGKQSNPVLLPVSQ